MAEITDDASILHDPDFPMLQVKVLYWGPGEAGKTTNFQLLKQIFSPFLISKGFSIETTTHRTLWNDSVHFQFKIPAFKINLVVIMTTTTGQQRFLNTREYILQNTDGVIFVADSSRAKSSQNKRSFEELQSFIGNTDTPILILLNKRDLPDAITVQDFVELFELPDFPELPGCAEEFKIIYESVATNSNNYGDAQSVFVDLIQKILKKKLVKER